MVDDALRNPKARDLKIGDRFWYIPGKFNIPPIVVGELRFENGKIVIIGNTEINPMTIRDNGGLRQEWHLHPEEPLNMPRRPNYPGADCAPRDYRDEELGPVTWHLRHGDIVKGDARIIRLLKAGGSISGWSSVHVEFLDSGNETYYRAATDSRFTWPYRTDKVIVREELDPAEVEDRLTRPRGPYVDSEGTEFYFWVHPNGRGRWDGSIPEYASYQMNSDGKFVLDDRGDPIRNTSTRPPTMIGQWKRYTYQGPDGRRHPSDPEVTRAIKRDRKRKWWLNKQASEGPNGPADPSRR